MNSLDYVVNKVLEVIRKDIRKNANGSYNTGTVKRIDGNIAWVQYDENNPQLTPVVISGASCKKGDEVRIQNNNGTAFILGNDSNPPTDDTKAEHAQVTAEISGRTAEEAQTMASEAEQTANGIKQHFWTDDDGAHVTEATQEDYQQDPANAGGNTLITSQGMAIRKGTTELASFGNSVLLGKIGGMQVEQTTTGMKFIGSDGYYYAKITADSSSGLDISNTASMLHVRIGNIIELVNDMGEGLQVNATSGDITATGNLTASNIGAKNWVAPSAVSCQSGKWYNVAEVTLDPGIWFIDCNAYFPKKNTTGTRQIRVTTDTFTNGTTTMPGAYGSIGIDVQMGVNEVQYPQAHFPVDISSRTTFRLAAYQGSGSTISVTGRMYATRIK